MAPGVEVGADAAGDGGGAGVDEAAAGRFEMLRVACTRIGDRKRQALILRVEDPLSVATPYSSLPLIRRLTPCPSSVYNQAARRAAAKVGSRSGEAAERVVAVDTRLLWRSIGDVLLMWMVALVLSLVLDRITDGAGPVVTIRRAALWLAFSFAFGCARYSRRSRERVGL